MNGLAVTAFVATIMVAVSSFSTEPAVNSTQERILASQIYSAAFNDISPGFDDLYVIKTQDKGREIVIYCNATYCYKNRNSLMTS